MEGKFDFEKERNDDLMRNFKHLVATTSHINMPALCRKLVKLPSRRFYVSEKRAAAVIGRMMKGYDLSDMRPLRAEMFREIYKRVMEMRDTDEKRTKSISHIVSLVVLQQAPQFYLTENRVHAIICRLRRTAKAR